MAGSYLTTPFKISDIRYDSVTESDPDWLADTLLESNMQIENDTRDKYKSFPTDSTTSLFTSYKNSAIAWFKYKWAIRERDEKGIEFFLKEYNSKKNGLRNVSDREETGAHRFSSYY